MNDYSSRKLTAVGLLASGVAHDFNNLLAIIEGYSYILQQRIGSNPALQDKISAILTAAHRGNELTQVIADFIAMDSDEPADIVATLSEAKPLLRALLSSRIEISFQVPAAPALVTAGKSTIIEELIFMAAEIAASITGAGQINFSINLSREQAELLIQDNNSENFTRRIFERVTANELKDKTILVVDDEEALLPVLEQQLEDLGMKVLKAANADTALLLQKNYPDAIDFLLTDIVMPDIDGIALAEMISSRQPGMGVVYMTGYNKPDLPDKSLILPKPLKPENLSRILQAALEKVTDA